VKLEHVQEDIGGKWEGLCRCTVCDAVEGEQLTFCPGFKLSDDAREACFQGNVIDLRRAVARRRRVG